MVFDLSPQASKMLDPVDESGYQPDSMIVIDRVAESQ
jgi:hypothetical protein